MDLLQEKKDKFGFLFVCGGVVDIASDSGVGTAGGSGSARDTGSTAHNLYGKDTDTDGERAEQKGGGRNNNA